MGIKIETDYGFKRPPVTYRANIGIQMNPKALFGDRFKDGSEEHGYIQKMLQDSELEIDKERSFLAKSFSYTFICDEVTGLSLIYDNTDKIFIDEAIEYGSFLNCNSDVLKSKYGVESSLVNSDHVLKDGSIGPADPIAPLGGMGGEPFSTIPIDAIIDALLRLTVYWGNPMNAVKKFYDDLQKGLSDLKNKYDTSDVKDFGLGMKFQGAELDKKHADELRKHTGMEIYDEHLYSHRFISSHLVVSIALRVGKKKNILG